MCRKLLLAWNVLPLFFLFAIVLHRNLVGCTLCKRSPQCNDEDPQTIDFCWVPYSSCLNIARQSEGNQTFALRSLNSILEETNRFPLTLKEKQTIVSAAMRVMAEINPHRFLQLNLLKIDIVNELDQFLASLNSLAAGKQSNVAFHSKMISIFQKMNDRHTMYFAPPPLRSAWASLLFNVKDFFDGSDLEKQKPPRRRYVVADVAEEYNFSHPAFGKGVEILKWNGQQIDSFVLQLGRESYGSNQAAQISNAIPLLTIRYLAIDLFPSQRFVNIQFRDVGGYIHTMKTPWFFFGTNIRDLRMTMRPHIPFSWKGKTHKQEREDSPGGWEHVPFVHQRVPAGSESVRLPKGVKKRIRVSKQFEDLFDAEIVPTKVGPIGLLTLPSFNYPPIPGVLKAISRILKVMPRNGLVIDIRYNLGGLPDNVKALSEFVSDKTVVNRPLFLRASDLMSSLSRELIRERRVEQVTCVWLYCNSAIETARNAGEPFTGPIGNLYNILPLRQEQVYAGPVVTLVNGLTYSTGDIFAAVQVDQNISLLVGTSDNVGAGGSVLRRYSSLAASYPRVLKPLPGGVDFTTSFFRFYRTDGNSGAILEYFGVKPHVIYYPTLNDAVNDDSDLFEFLGKKLASMSK